MTRVICQMVLFVKAVMSLSLSPSHGFDASQVHIVRLSHTHGMAMLVVQCTHVCRNRALNAICPQSKEQHMHDQSSSKRVESK